MFVQLQTEIGITRLILIPKYVHQKWNITVHISCWLPQEFTTLMRTSISNWFVLSSIKTNLHILFTNNEFQGCGILSSRMWNEIIEEDKKWQKFGQSQLSDMLNKNNWCTYNSRFIFSIFSLTSLSFFFKFGQFLFSLIREKSYIESIDD